MNAPENQLTDGTVTHHILVVDDDDALRALMAEILKDEGYTVSEASTGYEALQLIEQNRPDLVLLDVRMPGMSGFEVCESIRQDHDEASVSIAMVTGLEDHASIETAYGAGATSFINKPINWTIFPHRIRYILKSRDSLARLQQRETQLRHLDLITRILTQDKPYDSIMHEALMTILEIFDAERAFIVRAVEKPEQSIEIEFGTTRDEDNNCIGDISPLFDNSMRDTLLSMEGGTNPVLHSCPLSDDCEGAPHVYQQMLLTLHIQQDARWYLLVQQRHEGRDWSRNDSDIFYNSGTRLSGMLSRHLLMEKLHHSERLLRQAQQLAHIGNWHWSVASNRMTWSSEAYRILGYEPDSFEPEHHRCYRIAYEQDLRRLCRLRQETLDNGKAYSIEYRIRLGDDRIRWVFEQAFGTINESGMVTEINGTIQDITDRHQKQEQEAHERRMESIGQLTSGIAHDFGNLMTIAKGNLDLLRDMFQDDERLTEDEYSIIEDAGSAIADSVDLTSQLLNFSRKKSLAPKFIRVDEHLEKLRKLLSHILTGNIEISTIIDTDLPEILVDPSQLESALLNICINSRNAMPDGGSISISASLADADPNRYSDNPMVEIDDTYVGITIRDTGIGMSEDVADRAIEPFFTTSSSDGTGLGLSMVYGFMRQSKGELYIDSVQDKGTAIQLQFPVYSVTKEDEDVADDEILPQLAQATILVVEDKDSVRQFAIRCLGLFDIEVLQAGDANEALQVFRDHDDIDLMFSDIVMPGEMNGRQLARYVREHWPRTRVLLTTASIKHLNIEVNEKADAFDLLPKPYNKHELIRAVNGCLQH